MSEAFDIQDLSTDAGILSAWPVMRQLRPAISSENEFLQRVRRQEAAGFRLTGLSHEGKMLAVAGWRFMDMLSDGLRLYVDDLVTDEKARSRGCGQALLKHLEERAKQAGCQSLQLDSGIQRKDAHRFYLREGMEMVHYHFKKVLK